jgi:predicted heme/steroid binding protein
MGGNLLKSYSKSQLALRNGQDKEEIWCSYNGKIYELTHSKMWKNGQHYEHWAGQDLTDELKDAPHADKVFTKFRIIGELIDKNS